MKALKILGLGGLFLAVATPALAQFGTGDASAFVEAVRKSDGNAVSQLLANRPVGLVDSRDSKGDTGLLIALARRDEEWVAFLLTKGAGPNVAGNNGETPLIAAARVGFEDAIGWLLTLKARVDDDNRMGETALIVAVQQHHPAIVRALLKAGANPDKTDYSGYSARDHARRDPRARDILQLFAPKTPAPATAAKP